MEIDARAIFEGFPPGLRKALESGSLERVNEVLGKMSVEEAEEVVPAEIVVLPDLLVAAVNLE